MARRRYQLFNGAAAALTAAMPAVTTGTSLKTMLQIKPTTNVAVIAWGYSFDAVPVSPVTVELITTGTVAATVTAFAAADVVKFDDAGTAASAISLGVNASGYTATAEGSIVSSRLLACRREMAQSYECQFPLDREPGVIANDILRVRATTATALGMTCWVTIEE